MMPAGPVVNIKGFDVKTLMLLMVQYDGKAVIPVDDVCRDYFSHLDPTMFLRKVASSDISIPLIRMESSQKSHKGIHVQDLAKYLDDRRAAAVKECEQLTRRRF